MIDRKWLAVGALALLAGPLALAQARSAPEASCGDGAVQFRVHSAEQVPPTAPPAGKALVFFIEKDVGAPVAATSRAGLDGQWMGATHGNAWFDFAVDPGAHHLCAATHFSGWIGGGDGTALAHFDAEAGQIYYFEVKNFTFSAERQTDVSLTRVDSDEGRYLLSAESFAASVRKK
jgi:hypothetical protein